MNQTNIKLACPNEHTKLLFYILQKTIGTLTTAIEWVCTWALHTTWTAKCVPICTNHCTHSVISYSTKGRLSYHLRVECFSQLSFDSEVYTKSAAVADFVYTSESNESCEKYSTQR